MKSILTITKALFAILIFCSTLPAHSQKKKINGCGYIIPPRNRMVTNFNSVYEARDIVKQMLNKINWQENFSLREQNGIQNAYATIINNIRWIVYDNSFLEDIDAYTKTKWSSISVMAHEMGHHYYNHVVSRTGSTIPKELEADAFSGYMMALLGATREQSIAAISMIASDQASSTHPGKADRIEAISQGWEKAGITSNTKNPPPNNPQPIPAPVPNSPSAETPSPQPIPSGTVQTDPSNDPSWIALYMYSNKDETVYLSDDGKNYQTALIKSGQPFVFKFEIYNYGWLRLKYYNGFRVYKLTHGNDYIIAWNRRTGNWVVNQIGD
ncbi:MAG: M48 family metalloprotease [Bacteroidetes bacterium]|nr:M48 family metalloprotease [Bacteroidota bacterium]